MNTPILILIVAALVIFIAGIACFLSLLLKPQERPKITWEVLEKPDGIDLTVTEHRKDGTSFVKTWHCENKFGISWRDEQGRTELDVNGLYSPYNCEELFTQKKFLIRKYGETLA